MATLKILRERRTLHHQRQHMRPAGQSARPMPRRFVFSRERLAGVKRPAKGRTYAYDTRTPHLAYMVTDKGASSWVWYGRVRGIGRPTRFRIGAGDELPLERARDEAATITAAALRGVTPAELHRAKEPGKSFGEVFKWYIAEHAKRHKRSWKEDLSLHDRYLRPLDGRKLPTITGEEVRRLHGKVGGEAPTGANRMLALLSVVFSKARAAGFYAGEPPTMGVSRFKEHARDRFLQADELPRFMKALADEPSEGMRDFFELALWTGARRSNLLSMRWEEVDEQRGVWTIPASKAKADRPIAVPLSRQALAVLARRRAGRSPWVFPSNSAAGHLREPKKAWAALLKRAKLQDLRIHDLRRTFGSWQAVTGASLPVIGKSLGHSNQSTTAIYARLNMDPVRDAVTKAAEAMQAAIDAKPRSRKNR